MRIAFFSLLALSASALLSIAVITPKNPLEGLSLYVPESSKIANWVAENPTDGRTVDIAPVAQTPQSVWLTGSPDDISTLQGVIASSTTKNTVPVVVLYNIPTRDCGSHSAGGAQDGDAYKSWLSRVATVSQNNKIIYIIEPDALANMDCLSDQDKETRTDLINQGISILSRNSNAYTYIDAGHPGWQKPDLIADRLKAAGLNKANGFALNVSNFVPTNDVVAYGEQISKLFLRKKGFVIDTSRNGNGAAPNGEWCNPTGRTLGNTPTTNTGLKYVDAFLWIKNPGESDGECNGGPTAGTFWPQYVYELVHNKE